MPDLRNHEALVERVASDRARLSRRVDTLSPTGIQTANNGTNFRFFSGPVSTTNSERVFFDGILHPTKDALIRMNWGSDDTGNFHTRYFIQDMKIMELRATIQDPYVCAPYELEILVMGGERVKLAALWNNAQTDDVWLTVTGVFI